MKQLVRFIALLVLVTIPSAALYCGLDAVGDMSSRQLWLQYQIFQHEQRAALRKAPVEENLRTDIFSPGQEQFVAAH
jgi:hypothetical protein